MSTSKTGKVVKADPATIAAARLRGSTLDPLVDLIRKFKAENDSTTTPVPKGTTVKIQMSKVNTLLRRRGYVAPKGFKLAKMSTSGGKEILLVLLKDNGKTVIRSKPKKAKRAAKKARKPKAHRKVSKKAKRKPTAKKPVGAVGGETLAKA